MKYETLLFQVCTTIIFQIKKQLLIVDWNQIINKIEFPRNLKIELTPRQEVSIVSHARLFR